MEYYLQKKKTIKNREMRNFTFKGLFLAVVFIVLGSLSIQAADGLITKQITIKLDEAGTLPNKIGSTKKFQITNLKIIGEINGRDLQMIREMAGKDVRGNDTDGMLSVLDLSDAKIVEGGGYNINGFYYPTSNDKIGDNAFCDCSGLTSLTLPSGVTEIGNAAFEGCSGLASLTLPSGVTKIGDNAFCDCSGLTSLTLPSDVTEIGNAAFEGCSGLASLTLPSGVTKIGYSAFLRCSGLTSLTLPSGVTKIGNAAFEGCSGLTSLTLPSGVAKIGDYAFHGCSGLTSIYVYAEKLPNMGNDVFEGCDAKKCTVYVPKGTYDDYWLSEFGYFENIVEFDPTGINNVITSNDAKELSRYSVNGQRLSAPTKGLNIVKYSDGSVKKVAVQ
ncbi:leucine-rich repeat domain-containing protein [Prevotella copri]|uniref:Leucine-rich repeat domain-containing protein n=3 Tax=Segatella copri TaxID=165179 RepID=A0A6A7VLN9_9BACT|nr:leucine-rich repeat domain-containing protein [Segatella copri]MQO55581.1 leucine-rich repeat domain-containing protein [Segatella copri]